MTDIRSEFRRYAELISPLTAAAPTFVPVAESAMDVQVERGIVFADALHDPYVTRRAAAVDRLLELARSPRLASISVVDRSGHHRPVYRALLAYSWLQAFQLAYETLPRAEFGQWEEGVRAWCDALEAQLGEIEWPRDNVMPAGRGSSASEAAFIALALRVAGQVFVRDAWTDLASDTFGRIVGRQQASGTFLLAGASDNPETHWYHELILLHAAASYAVQSEDRRVAAAVARATSFHLEQTQPDHATAQPWALFAFIWNPPARTLADQLLHAAQHQHAADTSGVSLMLLADALYCLRLFL